MKLKNTAPTFEVGAIAHTGKDSTITRSYTNRNGGYAVIGGFSDLVPGQGAICGGTKPLIWLECW